MTKAEYMKSNIDIGMNIRNLRLSLGLSIGEFAERTGMTGTSIYNGENGYSRPRDESLEKIAAALNCEVDELLSKQPIKRRTSVNAKPRLEKCLNCVWGKIEDNIVFCPFVDCLKYDQVFKNARYGGAASD